MVFLELKYNNIATQIVVEQELVTIGRSKSCTYSIPDSNLSSRHCQLYIKDNFLFIEDLDSKNGVLLNGIKVSKEKIYLNDILNIGAATLSIDRLNLDPDSIDILTAPASDDRNLNFELTSPMTKIKLPTKSSARNAFKIKSLNIKTSNTKKLSKNKLFHIFKVSMLIVTLVIVYKLLR